MQFEEHQDLKRSIMADVMDHKSISSEPFLNFVINEYLVDSKRIDHEDVTVGYFDQIIDKVHCRMDGYMFNTTHERLQVFIIDDSSYDNEDLTLISKAEDYSNLFKSAYNFIRRVFLGHLTKGHNPISESVPNNLTKAFITNMALGDIVKDIDTVEIFLVTLNLTVRKDSFGKTHLREDMEVSAPNPLKFKVNFKNQQIEKSINIKYSLVDLNFLYRIHTSINGREPIRISLSDDEALDFIQVANEEDFKSYLTALPGNFLFKIYSDFSSRLLEKNIRAFLDFKNTKDNVNSGMKKTIVEEPHKFVAFNNGLTITCNQVDIQSVNGLPKIVGFDDFQIVNGGQTTASIYFTAMQKNDVSQVKVMAKINMIGSHDKDFDDFVADISNYSNAQNKVNKVDLRSNDPILQKIKSLSNSVVTPLGKKWFYEKSRGELGAVKRKHNWTPSQLNANYPKTRRFQNTELAKYYSAWGNVPYKIKKGGESVFLDFIEAVKSKGLENINKNFYENTIARVILFRNLEKLHGAGKNAIGQLRSAVIPYSIAILFNYASEKSDKQTVYTLDFYSIWKDEVISTDMEFLFKDLMYKMYDWIDKYKTSTDISENTKKADLWNAIAKSYEVRNFIQENAIILDKIIVKEISSNNQFFDFSELRENVVFHNKGYEFYKQLKLKFLRHLTYEEQDQLDNITSNFIIERGQLPKLINQFGLDKNLITAVLNKKSKTTKQKIFKAEQEKKKSLTLKDRHIDFLNNIEKKVASIDPNVYSSLVEDMKVFSFDMILDDIEYAFNDNDFSKLFGKAMVSQKRGVNIKYHIEYLQILHEFAEQPRMIDLYQLSVLYGK